MPLYLGIDAGGTKTDCAVSNGAELLGQATGASCKLARVGKERGRENLQAVIRQATETARVDPARSSMSASEWPELLWPKRCIGRNRPSAS